MGNWTSSHSVLGDKGPQNSVGLLNPKSGHHPSSAENSARALPSEPRPSSQGPRHLPDSLPLPSCPSLGTSLPAAPAPGLCTGCPLGREPSSPAGSCGSSLHLWPGFHASRLLREAHPNPLLKLWLPAPTATCNPQPSPACPRASVSRAPRQVTHLSWSMLIVHPPAENKLQRALVDLPQLELGLARRVGAQLNGC